MIGITLMILFGGAVLSSSEPSLERYRQYVAYVVKAFTPPRSFFEKREQHIDHTQGEKERSSFQKQHGEYGEISVDLYGRGLSKQKLIMRGLL